MVRSTASVRAKQFFDDDDANSEFLKNLVLVIEHDVLQSPHLRPKPLRTVHHGLEITPGQWSSSWPQFMTTRRVKFCHGQNPLFCGHKFSLPLNSLNLVNALASRHLFHPEPHESCITLTGS